MKIGVEKLRVHGLPDGENRMMLRSLAD